MILISAGWMELRDSITVGPIFRLGNAIFDSTHRFSLHTRICDAKQPVSRLEGTVYVSLYSIVRHNNIHRFKNRISRARKKWGWKLFFECL